MAIAYRDAARHFNGRPVRAVLADADNTSFVGTLHPAPDDGLEHVELRDASRGRRLRVDVDDIATLTVHRRPR